MNTKRTAPKRIDQEYKLTPVGKALATLIAKPEPRHRRPGGGRKLAPWHVIETNRGAFITLTVTHLTYQERVELLESIHGFWEIEFFQSQLARTAARNAAKGITA